MSKPVTHKSISYGMSVDVLNQHGGNYKAATVHFFNKKGVLVGHGYEWLPYERLRHRDPDKYSKNRNYFRFYYGKRFERIRNALIRIPLSLTSALLRFCEPRID